MGTAVGLLVYLLALLVVHELGLLRRLRLSAGLVSVAVAAALLARAAGGDTFLVVAAAGLPIVAGLVVRDMLEVSELLAEARRKEGRRRRPRPRRAERETRPDERRRAA